MIEGSFDSGLNDLLHRVHRAFNFGQVKEDLCKFCGKGREPGYFFTERHAHLKVHYDELIGRAGSNVFAGTICGLSGRVAVKQIRILTEEKKVRFENEIKMMNLFSGLEGFVQCLGSVFPTDDQELGMIIMEKCDATFEDIISGNYLVSARDGQSYDAVLLDLVKQIIQAVQTLACSDTPIAHRDLKSDNLFIRESRRDQKLIAKIGDFGTSREFPDREFRTTDRFGHANYLAPELLKCVVEKLIIKYDPAEWHAIDMFAIGCCIAELFTGLHPFGTPDVVTHNIKTGNISFDAILELPFSCRGQLCNLICALTQRDPSQRPTAADCLKHPLFQDPATKVTRISDMNTILKRIDHGEESKDPERKKLLQSYDENSALVIGGKGNWLHLVPDQLKCCLNKGYDITKASGLCRFVRNVIQHLGEDRPELKLTVFGNANLSQARLFLEFEDIWPLIDGHNAGFLCQEEKCASPIAFSAAQYLLEATLLEEGLKNGRISRLQTVNSIRLHVNDGPSQALALPCNVIDKVSAHVAMDKLRKKVSDLKFTKNSYELLDANGNKLKDPILDSAEVHLKFKQEIFHI